MSLAILYVVSNRGISKLVLLTPRLMTITRVSVDSAGNQANDWSVDPSISADGRFVAFESYSSNLVPGETNNLADIFVRDLSTNTTTRVSVDSAGNQANGLSSQPSISADGRFVAFYSDASNLVPGDTNNLGDIFVRDLLTNTTTRVSVDSAGNQGNLVSSDPSISTIRTSAANIFASSPGVALWRLPQRVGMRRTRRNGSSCAPRHQPESARHAKGDI